MKGVVTELTEHFSPGDKSWSCRKRLPTMAQAVLPNLEAAVGQSGKAFTAAMQGKIWVGRYNKVAAWGQLEQGFNQALEDDLATACTSRTLSDAFKRLTTLTTQNYADAYIARWMEHAVPKHAVPPDSETSKLKQRPSKRKSIARVNRTAGALSLGMVTARSDSGGAGTNNGVVDVGEWAYIDVEVLNKSTAPYFSSSAWVSTSGCAFVPEEGMEIRLAEMSVGGKATMSFWMYQGPCASQAAPSVLIHIFDSHQSESTFQLNFKLGNPVTTPKLHTQILDQDMPGFSHQQDDISYVRPGSFFELTHELTVAGNPSIVDLEYAVPSDAKAIFKIGAHIHRSTEMRHVGNGRYKARDDWDREVQGPLAQYRYIIQNLKGSKRWLDAGTPGPIWLAVDVTVNRGNPTKDSATGATKRATRPAPSAKVVSRLLRDSIKFRSRPATPSADAAAAVAGHDVLLDFETFELEYNALTGRSANEGEGHALDFVKTDGRGYSYRYYVPLTVEVPSAPAKPKPKPRPRQKQKPRPPAPPVAVASQPTNPWIRLDVGVGGGMLFINSDLPSNDPTWAGSELATSLTMMLLEGGAMLTLGKTWSGFLEVRGGQQTLELQKIRNSRWSANLGLAYIISLGGLEIQPRAGVSFNNRSFDRDLNLTTLGATNDVMLQADDFTVAGTLGLTLRYYFTSWFGLHLDVATLLGEGGPAERKRVAIDSYATETTLDEAELSTPLINGSSVHFGAGLSVRF